MFIVESVISTLLKYLQYSLRNTPPLDQLHEHVKEKASRQTESSSDQTANQFTDDDFSELLIFIAPDFSPKLGGDKAQHHNQARAFGDRNLSKREMDNKPTP